nr:zf-BED domain-containing protein [Tanacetum cinerariifolium]
MDDDLEQRMSHEADDDTGYDPSDVAFTEWLGSKKFKYKTMDQYTKKALWIYWIRRDDEVELMDEEFFDNKDDVAEIYEWNENVPWVCDKPWLDKRIWKEPTPVKHTCKPFNYKIRCSEWPTYSWREDGYCNAGNLPRAYHIGNSLHYHNLEWYEALEDIDLKEQALRNKSIMEGSISDDESSNDCWKNGKAMRLPTTIRKKLNMRMKLMIKDMSYVKLTNCRCAI